MKHVTHFRWRQLKNVIEAGRRFLFVLAKTKTNWSGGVEGLKGALGSVKAGISVFVGIFGYLI